MMRRIGSWVKSVFFCTVTEQEPITPVEIDRNSMAALKNFHSDFVTSYKNIGGDLKFPLWDKSLFGLCD